MTRDKINFKSYHFPTLNESEETGFNDPLINNFREPIYNLTRESIQNIVDAKDPRADGPAIAKFELFKVSPKDIPDSPKLKTTIEACWRHEKEDKSEGEEFFKKAFDLLNNNRSIDVLKISDYNTTGLFGDDKDRSSAYYKLMRIQGSSNKTRGMGGTYGLGKGAYFRPSLFRTIFVSSVWDRKKVVFQGKLRFVSHLDDGVMKHGIGYYSFPAIRNKDDIPELFQRDENGTSIFILGFEESHKWQKQMIEGVLKHFWLAILEDMLEVKIGEILISKDNLEEKIYENFSEENYKDDYNPMPFYRAYKEGQIKTAHLPMLGSVELRVLLGKDLPRRVEYFRNTGMVIQNKQLNSAKGFAGVFVSPDQNEVLRKMEDPEHKVWSKENPTTSNPEEKKRYAGAEKELKDFVKSILDEMTATIETSESTIKDLDKYFYSPADENEIGDGNPESIEGQIVREETGAIIRGENPIGVNRKINIQVHTPIETRGESDGEGTGGGKGTGTGGGLGSGRPDDQGSQFIKINKNIRFRRSFVKNGDSKFEHVIFVSGDPNNNFDMGIQVGTEDSYDTLDVERITDDKRHTYELKRVYTKNHEISHIYAKNIIIPDDGSLKLFIVFSNPGKYSLNLKAYESQ